MRILLGTQPHFPVLLALAMAVLLNGCGPTASTRTLLASSQDLTVPTGPVHLPSIKDGYGFQGILTLDANQHRWHELGKPDKDVDLAGQNIDTVIFGSPLYVRLPLVSASGEASVILGGLVRLSAGMDFDERSTWWLGTGYFTTGPNWYLELGGAIGKLGARRHELWSETWEEESRCGPDTCFWISTPESTVVDFDGNSMFWKLEAEVAHMKSGILAGYQLIDLPVTKAPYDGAFSLLTHTFTLGWFKPTRIGTLSLFAQTTWLGKSWSPSARVQYSFVLGGNKGEPSESD